MTARERILRDNGLLMLAAAVAVATTGSAAAARRPNPHNFAHPSHTLNYRPAPHNFSANRDAL
jgi:hypothetical protein